MEGERGAGGAIELWRTFPHTHTTQATQGQARAFLVLAGHVHRRAPCFFCPWRCLLPEGVDNYFTIMPFIAFAMLASFCRSANANADALRTIKRRSLYRSPAVSAAAIRRY